jgi:hypothetical protein
MDAEKLAGILNLRNAEKVTLYAWYLAHGFEELPALLDELAASEAREKQLRDALVPFVTGAEELHAKGYVTYVTHEQVWEARQAIEGSGE